MTTASVVGMILVGQWRGRVAPGFLVTPTRFRVLADGRLRKQGGGGWIDTRERVEASYGPLRPEADDSGSAPVTAGPACDGNV